MPSFSPPSSRTERLGLLPCRPAPASGARGTWAEAETWLHHLSDRLAEAMAAERLFLAKLNACKRAYRLAQSRCEQERRGVPGDVHRAEGCSGLSCERR